MKDEDDGKCGHVVTEKVLTAFSSEKLDTKEVAANMINNAVHYYLLGTTIVIVRPCNLGHITIMQATCIGLRATWSRPLMQCTQHSADAPTAPSSDIIDG